MPETVHKHLMSTLGTKATITGVILCVLGLSLFAYGMSSMSYASAVSNSHIVIIGIFTGMAGMFILVMDLFAHMH